MAIIVELWSAKELIKISQYKFFTKVNLEH